MLFRLGVKTRLDEFYDFEEELGRLIAEINAPDTRMIVLKGLRRTGKSSLLRVALNEAGVPHIVLDVRMLGPLTPEKLYDIAAEALSDLVARSRRLRLLLENVRGLSVSGFTVTFQEKTEKTFLEVLRQAERWAASRGSILVLAFDEAQDLRLVPGFDRLLAHIYDYRPRIKLILTGSEVGVLDRLLGKNNPRAPLYGRSYAEIQTRRLSPSEALDFLERGFREQGASPPVMELEEAVSRLDGIIGWLTAYGYYRLRMGHREALNKVVEQGAAIAAQEIEHFLAPRQQARTRYLAILKLLTARPLTWSQIKRGLQAELGRRIPDNRLSHLLHELQSYGFIEKREGRYWIPDPLTAQAVLNMR